MNGMISVQAQGTGMTRAGCTIWRGYLPSFTGEGGLLCSQLATMPVFTALTVAHGRCCISSGDISHLHWVLDSHWVFCLGLSTSIWLTPVSVFCFLLRSLVSLSLPSCNNVINVVLCIADVLELYNNYCIDVYSYMVIIIITSSPLLCFYIHYYF